VLAFPLRQCEQSGELDAVLRHAADSSLSFATWVPRGRLCTCRLRACFSPSQGHCQVSYPRLILLSLPQSAPYQNRLPASILLAHCSNFFPSALDSDLHRPFSFFSLFLWCLFRRALSYLAIPPTQTSCNIKDPLLRLFHLLRVHRTSSPIPVFSFNPIVFASTNLLSLPQPLLRTSCNEEGPTPEPRSPLEVKTAPL